MMKLSAPLRTRVEIGEEAFDPDDENGDAPPEIEIGRALAIARLGCLPHRIGPGIELLIGTCQRRRAVTGANRWRYSGRIPRRTTSARGTCRPTSGNQEPSAAGARTWFPA